MEFSPAVRKSNKRYSVPSALTFRPFFPITPKVFLQPLTGARISAVHFYTASTPQILRTSLGKADNAAVSSSEISGPIKGLPQSIHLEADNSTAELYRKIALQARCDVLRLRITADGSGKVPLASSKDISLKQANLLDNGTIYVKDLGPQISWQTVFVVEYAGPLLIHPLIYFLRPHIYRNGSSPASELQTISLLMITAHFLKRELETLFVHRFSNASMPVFNIFKNSAHYWFLAGLLIAYFTYAPNAPTAAPSNSVLTYVAVALYVVGELGNLNAHLCLRRLRSAGGTERGIPRGLGFGVVTCPNYMFEVLAWLAIATVNRSWSTLVFIGVAGVQMLLWAKKKEHRLRKDFGDKYKKKRFVMLPGIC
ncbi:MAG: 3-oxo-5a-steroid 4- dehydrogenase [Bathelium mastoideum]|nr:MAG: 3-oxo-5a-steroid 4- dehydrogenase [Bathelium mastoideum]